MKKTLYIVLVSAMIIGLCACGNKVQETEEPTSNTTIETTNTSESDISNTETTEETKETEEKNSTAWYVEDKTAEELADIAYSYVTNLPKIGMSSEEYYSTFMNTNYSTSGWDESTNKYEGKGKPVTEEGFGYGSSGDKDYTKDLVSRFEIENLWVDENFKYAGSAYDNIGQDYTGGKQVVLSFHICVPTEERAMAIFNAYIEKYGAEFGYTGNPVDAPVPRFASAANGNNDYIAMVDYSSHYGVDTKYYEIIMYNYI